MIQQRPQLTIGTIISSGQNKAYTVEGILGQGGFSSVYLVRDQSTEPRLFALKELTMPRSQEKLNLTFEAEVLMRLLHPSLPHIYEVFEDTSSSRTYLLMDYIKGKDLEILREEQANKRYPLILVIVLISPIVEAISYLHTQTPPIVHRDIKPANIIVPTESGDAFLVDFGLAKEYIKDKTTNIFRYGTPGYAAPEQYGQGTSLQTDVYGLAATIYTLLTGTVPPDAITRSFNKQTSDPLKRADQLNPTIPAAIGKILSKALSLQPEERYVSVDDFWKNFTLTVEIQAIGCNDTIGTMSLPITSPLLPPAQPASPLPQPVTLLAKGLIIAPPAELERLARQSRRPVLPIISLIVLLLVVIGSAATRFLSWPSPPSHNTPPAASTRHLASSTKSLNTCISSNAQIAPCSSATGPTPSPTSSAASKASSISSVASQSSSTISPTPCPTTPTPSTTGRSSSTTTPTPSTATPTSSTATPTPSTATPTPSAIESILSTLSHSPSTVTIQAP